MPHKDPRKATRTSRYLLDQAARKGDDGTLAAESSLWLPSSGSHRRCWWTITPKLDYDPNAVARHVVADPRNPWVFADTSLFDDRTPLSFWRTMLDGGRRITIVPTVRRELDPWLESHRDHPAAQAVLLGDQTMDIQTAEANEDERFTFEYYVSLLGLRKRAIRSAISLFEARNGRPPDDAERSAIRSEHHKMMGPRGYLIARKGEESKAPILTVDERLVYSAVAKGLRTGRPVYILTKDEDVQEQFYKLLWLIDSHYRGMLLARAYHGSPERFRTWSMPMADPAFEGAFEGSNNILLEMMARTYSELLPSLFTPIEMMCLVMGTRLTQMMFTAEHEMRIVLDVKTATKGLNTDLLQGRNCHISLEALPPPKQRPPFERCAAIAFDRRRQMGASSAIVSVVDGYNALGCVEQIEPGHS